MKIVFQVLAIVITTSILFGAGYFLGTNSAFSTALVNHNFFQKNVVDAFEDVLLLEKIGSGKTQEAIETINLKVNCKILIIHSFLPEIEDKNTKRIANNLLLRIAKHREKYPSQKAETETVNGILKEVLEKRI